MLQPTSSSSRCRPAAATPFTSSLTTTSPPDEDGEQYQTYFLNMVDEADLLAAMQAAGGELPACSCTEKCAVGAIHTDCTVCAVNMGECQGKAPEPAPAVEPEPDPEPEQPKNTAGRFCWFWPWRFSAAVQAGTSKSTVPSMKKLLAADAAVRNWRRLRRYPALGG